MAWPKYTAGAPPGAVTETMKELAGGCLRLVDSNERRSSVDPPLSSGNDEHAFPDNIKHYCLKPRPPSIHTKKQIGGDTHAAARTA
ncbi:hypothetical protein GCM10010353_24660 [Streptomyces chryseus]|uniref:Uncharacterized protein n=1 Tax=Streptomyces chryseus TaxID=68186 RepID=A0ABQ3DIW0_9ACTN|nr:hypothetical protein GCM10010353_24660 [Streptomyces chryseus]GHA99765.1 hypothetical protein GCM10010346_23280 [Streptomyces chryseus]